MADTMAAIAMARSQGSDAEGARRTLQRAEKAAETLQQDVRRSWLALALAWGRLGDKAAEVRLLKRAGPAQPGPNEAGARPADDLLAIAQAYRELGDVNTAGRAAEAAHRAAAAQDPRPHGLTRGSTSPTPMRVPATWRDGVRIWPPA